MRRFSLLTLAAAALLTVAGCSSTPDEAASADAAGAGRSGVSTAAVDESSLEYFQVTVGDRVFFETDRSDLTAQARATLDAQARWLQLNPQGPIVIEGHADERGTREYNLALGARRANAVRAYLVAQGVPADRMRAVTFGKERPVEVCSRLECWNKNRRAVTVVSGAGS
ncbi:MAG: peptidoglycan-associated lipoprotein Pal [Pseudomonadota bacterium]